MFQTSITIERKLAVRNGFVEIPDAPLSRNSLTPTQVQTLLTGTQIIRIGLAPSRIVDQQWVVLPSFDRFVGPSSDFFEDMRQSASS